MHSEKLVVAGQGYVGLALAIRAVEAGFTVVGLDVDAVRVQALRRGESYVEDVSSVRLAAALASGRYQPSDDYTDAAGFDVAVISVPTPLRNGAPDLTFVEEATTALGTLIRRDATVILESTTYPGTTEELVRPLLEAASGLRCPADFSLGYSPERIDPGNRTWRLDNTPKLVSGVDAVSLGRVRAFYDRIVEQTVAVRSTQVAELAKLIENTFRQVNIALVNELAVFAHALEVDVWDALDAASTKPFGFLPFRPGPGVGGHCLPIDPCYLSWQVKRKVGRQFRMVELADDINHSMPEYVVRRVADGLSRRGLPVSGTRILLLGLAYKPNTPDMRDSPAVDVANRLVRQGADLYAVEPHAQPPHLPSGLNFVDLTEAEVEKAEAVVILTDHDAFDYDMIVRHATYVFDCRDRCRGDLVERL